MRYDQQQILSLISHLYETVLDAGYWQVFLDELVEIGVGYNAAFHHYHRVGQDENQIHAIVNLDPTAVEEFEEYYSKINPWVVEGVKKGYMLPGSVATGSMIVDEGDLVKTEFYNDFAVPNGFHYSMGASIHHDPNRTSVLTLQRSHAQGDFDEEHIELMRVITPHMQRVLQIHSQFARARVEKDALLSSIDRIPLGIIIVNGHRQIVQLNSAAQQILDERDGLSLERQGGLTTGRINSRRLEQMIRSAVKTTRGEGRSSGGLINVERPSAKRPYSILVSPLPVSQYLQNRERPAAVVFITDPEGTHDRPEEALMRLYGLTPAEAELTVYLMGGRSIEEAAELRSVSRQTARNQLKSVFAKTDTHRQSELVGLLLRGPVALKTDDLFE